MIPNSRHEHRSAVFMAAGWLFAELMLGLAMVFLVASTPGVILASSRPPTSTPIPSPTATPLPLLDLNLHTVIITNTDAGGLVNAIPTAYEGFQRAVESQIAAQGISARCAGLVIPYAGQGSGDAYSYVQIGQGVITALQQLAGQGYPFFSESVYHHPLGEFDQSNGYVLLEIYLYTGTGQCRRS